MMEQCPHITEEDSGTKVVIHGKAYLLCKDCVNTLKEAIYKPKSEAVTE
jgi:hypothetical protein